MTELSPPTERLASEAHQRWQQARLEALQAADGWLTLVDLIWLENGTHRIGSRDDAEIVLANAPDSWGTLTLEGSAACWTDSATGAPQTLLTDRHGAPTVIRAGRLSFFLIERDQGLALRVRDEQATTRTGFAGIETFDFDLRWQVSAHWDGEQAHFVINGNDYRLRPQNPTATPMQFVIADQTSGRETYGGGRFLFVPAPEGEALLLDFNRAINPPCAFTPFAVCPLPPAENRLALAVTAGEKTYR